MYRVAIYTYMYMYIHTYHHHPRYTCNIAPLLKKHQTSNTKLKCTKMHSLHVQPAPVHCTPTTPAFQHCFSAPHFPGFPTSPLVSHSCGLSLSLSHTHSHSFNVFTCFNCPPCNLSLTTPPPSFSNSSTPRDPSACDICFST